MGARSKTMFRDLFRILTIFPVLSLIGCGGNNQPIDDEPPPTLTLSPSVAKVVLSGSTTFSASGGVPPYRYAIRSGGGSIDSASGVFTAPAYATSITVQVTDTNLNIGFASVLVTPILKIIPDSIILAASESYTFSTSGGTSPYTFSITSGGGSINSSTGVFTAPSSAGSTTVAVTDGTGQTSSATVTTIGALSISPSSAALAQGAQQTFSGSGGLAPYTFAIVSGGGSINASSGVFTAPGAPGTTVVSVLDSLGTSATANVTTVAPLQISPTSWTLAVNNQKTFSASGGQTPYTYSITSGTGTVNSSTGVYSAPAAAGSANLRVTDAIGQTSDATLTINSALAISPTNASSVASGTVNFSASGGVSPYTYSVVSGSGSVDSGTGVFTAPASADSTTVRVTDTRGNTSNATVTTVGSVSISPTSVTLAPNGQQTFTASGGLAPYTYSVTSGTGSVNSSSGVYTAPGSTGSATVRATDSLGQTADATVTVVNSLTISPASVTLVVNGNQTFTGVNGSAPYTYSIASGGGSINSSTGEYTAPATADNVVVRVTDNLSNTADAAVTVVGAVQISPTSFTMAVNNSKTFTANGGVAPYTYSVVSGGGTINSSTGLYMAPATSGSATVRVTDSLSNTSDATVTINAALAISPSAVTAARSSNVNFSATGGATPYTYSIVSGGGSINTGTGQYTTPSTSGTVTIRVTDSLSNTSDAEVTVVDPVAISPTSWTLAVNNTKTFSASGGQTPYSYSISSGSGTINSSTGLYTAPASAGAAVVRVTDAIGQTSESTVTINSALTISPSNTTVAVDGSVSFSASGGVTPYTYSIVSGGGSINAGTGAFTAPSTAQTVSVRVTDSLGNTSNATVTVTQALSLSPSSEYVILDDTLQFVASGGTGNYTFSITSGSGSIGASTGIYTAPASAGTTTVQVSDGNTTASATIYNYTDLTLSPLSTTITVNGTVAFSATGGYGALTYSIASGVGTIDSGTGLYTAPASQGTAVVKVQDSVGHFLTADVTVVSTLTLSPANLTLVTKSTVTFTAINGTAPYTFSIVSGGGTINASTGAYTAPITAQSVTVRVTDSLSFTNDTTVTVVEPVKVFTGGYNSCITTSDSRLKCWGDGAGGKLGSGSTTDRGDQANEMGYNMPFISVGTGRSVKDMAIGENHICAILDNDSVKCWGSNANGQLGIGSTSNIGDGAGEMGDSLQTVDLGSGKTAKKIAVGQFHSCAILNDDTVKCWGANASGQLGYNNTTQLGDNAGEMGDSLSTVNLGSGRFAVAISLGDAFTCAVLDDGSAKCWGANTSGQLGQGNTNTLGDSTGEMGALAAINVGTGKTVASLSAGSDFVCAILNDNQVKCWGNNSVGQLGQGSTTVIGDGSGEMGDSLVASSMGTGLTPSVVHSRKSHSCVLFTSGGIKCWGEAASGPLGYGSGNQDKGDASGEMGDNLPLVSIGTALTPSQLTSGIARNCVMTTSKQVKCWGSAVNGGLGSGSKSQHRGDGNNEMGDNLAFVEL